MLTAEPLDLDDKHEIIRRIHQEPRAAQAQVGELLLSRAIQLPPVQASDAKLGLDILPAHPPFRRRRTLDSVRVDAS